MKVKMKVKITATLAIISSIFSINSVVYGQSQNQPQAKDFTLNGDSLVNINDRRAETDFRIFFTNKNSQGLGNTTSEQLPWSQSIFMPSSPIFLQPANQDVNGNDGFQVQLDLSDDQ
ncbi:hypothetical protein WJM97_05575 [Okeanomitos corallinicola TIOX110]|uniref:Uncharacterized protein n=1 Tax=Okeanomitos corallinicola TIOX110 TaxID=3133117 RepID=A0ABZ2UUS9_9CYAN